MFPRVLFWTQRLEVPVFLCRAFVFRVETSDLSSQRDRILRGNLIVANQMPGSSARNMRSSGNSFWWSHKLGKLWASHNRRGSALQDFSGPLAVPSQVPTRGLLCARLPKVIGPTNISVGAPHPAPASPSPRAAAPVVAQGAVVRAGLPLGVLPRTFGFLLDKLRPRERRGFLSTASRRLWPQEPRLDSLLSCLILAQ